MRSWISILPLLGCLTAAAESYYVDASRPDDAGAGTSWDTAKMTIQAAVDLAGNGDTVLVTNGIYNTGAIVTPGGSLYNRVVVTNAITLLSVNGANVTFIEGDGTNLYGTAAAVRCVFMTNGVLDGFTLRGGATLSSSTPISGYGGGAYALGATLRNCTLANNWAHDGGGSAYGTLTNCAVTGNSASYGGGARYSTLIHCSLTGNSAASGGGSYFGSMVNCRLTGNSATTSGGGSYYGSLANCSLSGNSASNNGGGAYYGTLANCTLTANSASTGGGSYYGTLRNSILSGNCAATGTNWCGSALAYSCTTPLPPGTGNIAADPVLTDPSHIGQGSPCISAGNLAYCSGTDLDGEVWLAPPCMGCDQFVVETAQYFLIVNSAFGGADPPGATNRYGTVISAWVTNSPIMNGATQHVCVGASVSGNTFAPNSTTNVTLSLTNQATLTWDWQTQFQLAAATNGAGSVAGAGWFVAGSNAMFTATPAEFWFFSGWSGDTNDCTANGPTLTVSMTRARSVVALFTQQTVATPQISPPSGTVYTNTLSVTITCATADATIRYTTDGSEPTPDSARYTGSFLLACDATVRARAFKTGWADSAVASAAFERPGDCFFVDAARPDDSGTGASWATAKKTIQAAVNLAGNGDTVLVTNGIYNTGTTVTPGGSLINRVVVTKNITVQSVNGANVTVIEGAGTGMGLYGATSAVRCVFMNNGVLDGFTLRHGTAVWDFSLSIDNCGGGAYAFGALLRNCVLTNNQAFFGGGGVCLGTLTNCTLSGNSANHGGGSYNDTLNNCTLTGNLSYYDGGGSYNDTLNNCTLTNNSASNSGGGSYGGTLANCMLTGNSAPYGGGSYNDTLNNCTLTNNSASNGGGGSYGGTLANCMLTGNSAPYGGGSYYGTLSYCTLTGNSASYGGGAADGTLNNCILISNLASIDGGGSCYSVLNNCSLTRNLAFRSGGGSYGGTLNNCSLQGNVGYKAGGTYRSTLANCIVWGNENLEGTLDNYFGGTFTFSCTYPMPWGTGNIAVDPLLTDEAHIATNSPCIGAGNYSCCSGTDFDGEAWLNPPCMGCDQIYPTTVTLSVLSTFGGAHPTGTNSIRYGTVIGAWMTNSLVANGSTQYVCVGASVAGNAFTLNSSTNIALMLTNSATLTWLWQTNYWLATAAGAHGTVSVTSGWQNAGTATQLTAQADTYCHFSAWTGDANGASNPLNLQMDRPKSVVATFAADTTATHPTPHWWLAQYGLGTNFEQAAQADADRDGHSAWEEYVAGTVPTNGDSVFRANIAFSNGLPWVTWTPDLGAQRVYAVEGKTNLSDGAWSPTNSASRFFRVHVSLP